MPSRIALNPAKRVLFLTKDVDLLKRQLAGTLDITLDDIAPEQLLDDINTDAMTPAWACFDYRPEELARNAYAGLVVAGERVFAQDALRLGGFEVIVSGQRKGTGSSRETAVQAEKWSGIRIAIAGSFAPIHARNNICQGVLMAGYDVLRRLQRGDSVPIEDFMVGRDSVEREIIAAGGLFALTRAVVEGKSRGPTLPTRAPHPMTLAEKILARHRIDDADTATPLEPGDAVVVRVDAGYSHDYTTAQVHHFLSNEYGPNYAVRDASRFAVFEDHLIYADSVPRMAPFAPKIAELRELQREFQRHTGVRDYAARDGISPGICHQVAREEFLEPGDFVQATDSHTCMGGAGNALAWGVGATEYAALIHSGITAVTVPESIRFELHGSFGAGVSAKDLILHLLATFARNESTFNRVMEFGGPGLRNLSMDERATLANMATECGARSGICEPDEILVEWLTMMRPAGDPGLWRSRATMPDAGAVYHGGVHRVDLATIVPMVATPGDPDHGIPADPTNGASLRDIGDVRIDIAYGGSCTAGKHGDMDLYAKVAGEARAAGKRVAPGVEFLIQFGSAAVAAYASRLGYVEIFRQVGIRLIDPG